MMTSVSAGIIHDAIEPTSASYGLSARIRVLVDGDAGRPHARTHRRQFAGGLALVTLPSWLEVSSMARLGKAPRNVDRRCPAVRTLAHCRSLGGWGGAAQANRSRTKTCE